MIKSELLAPAGDYEKATIALDYGADAVFLGGKAYSLRSKASNFFMSDIKKTCEYAHQQNKRVYVAVNVICHNALINGFTKFFQELVDTGIDAIIVADPFIIDFVKQHHPQVELHLSTQQSVTNSKAALFWKNNGVTRIVLGREVTLAELKPLIQNVHEQLEIEYFIHGAVCIAFSGRCMMSNNWSLRDSNVGGCAQSCRWRFALKESPNSNPYTEMFTMSPKDMALVDEIKQLMEMGVVSFKIEGRMRSLNYVATVAKAYRQVIDQHWNNTKNKQDVSEAKRDLKYAENRPAGIAFSKGQPGVKAMLYHEEERKIKQQFAFIVVQQNADYTEVVGRNHFALNQIFTIFGPTTKHKNLKLIELLDANQNPIDAAKTPMKKYYLKFNKKIKLHNNDIGHLK